MGFGQWKTVETGTTAQFRGLCAVSRTVCWASGSNGTYARTIDGKNWVARQVPGAEKLQFRSVAAFDADHAFLLAIGPGDQSRIYHTDDGGATWALQFVNDDPKAFYDAIAFWDPMHGIAFSDPVNGKIPILRTSDGGRHWSLASNGGMPESLSDEGAFSASGACLVVRGTRDAWIATGGAAVSRVFNTSDRGRSWSVSETPIPAGKETSGVFGLRFRSSREGIAVGGDYKNPSEGVSQVALTHDGGKSWELSPFCPEGLKECAGYMGRTIVVVGPTSSEVSHDDGRTWSRVSGPEGLHTCGFSRGVGWAAGDKGVIARWVG